ncbi:hypothetical protein MPER_10941, partial [Moniliophthora perniciosa FA553]
MTPYQPREPYITKFDPYQPEECIVDPNGSWGTALARVAAINVAGREGFEPEVRMWVREREIPGKGLLTEIINTTHQNERYLPSVDLPDNLVAVSDVREVLKQPGTVHPRARAISAIKGVD